MSSLSVKYFFNNSWRLVLKFKKYNSWQSWSIILSVVLSLALLLSVLRMRTQKPGSKNVTVKTSIKLRKETDFNQFLLQPQRKCRKLVNLGGFSCKGQVDGNKYICLDDHLWGGTKGCLVYSFGISDETSFEETFWDWKQCEFHLFDPTIQEEDLPSQLKTAKHHFHQLGIWNKNSVLVMENLNKARQEFATFLSILKLLGHQNRTIHYLKMDVEGSEWEALINMLQSDVLKNVLQFNVEIHLKSQLSAAPRDRWLSILQEKYDLLSRIGASTDLRWASFQPNSFGNCVLRLQKNGTLPHPVCGELLFVRS